VPPTWSPPPEVAVPKDVGVVVIGCSTGGPRALRDLLARLKPPLKAPILVAQHMPPNFTQAFAERLKRASSLDVAEARDGETLSVGQVRIAPGGHHLAVEGDGVRLRTRIALASPNDRWVPSCDVLFRTAAKAVGERALALVLTGMGKDGVEGAKALRAAKAPLWCESALTAAVDGMPASAAAAHGAADRIPLDELALLLARALELS
jgi:two-component system chemotaxis response regulator CheB